MTLSSAINYVNTTQSRTGTSREAAYTECQLQIVQTR